MRRGANGSCHELRQGYGHPGSQQNQRSSRQQKATAASTRRHQPRPQLLHFRSLSVAALCGGDHELHALADAVPQGLVGDLLLGGARHGGGGGEVREESRTAAYAPLT